MGWLQGKKTYIAAVLIVILVAAGFWAGELDEFGATLLLVFAFGFVGVRDAIARTYAQLLLHVVEAAKEIREHKPVSAELKAELVSDAKKVLPEILSQ